jgi:hypothetical protein
VAKKGRWVTKSGRWVAKVGRWLTKSGRWVAKLLPQPACYGSSSLGSNQDISQKYKMGDISKGVADTHYCPPKIFCLEMIRSKHSGIFTVLRNDSERNSIRFLFRETGEFRRNSGRNCSKLRTLFTLRLHSLSASL